jgi:PKHD-type hydroxylase
LIDPLHIPDVFPPADCARLFAIASAGAFDDAGLVRRTRDDTIRRARVQWLDDGADAAWAMGRVVDTVIEANRRHFMFDLTEFAERMQIAWYDAAQEGHFDWHVDVGDGQFAQKRKLTLVVQLSDPDAYEGGALEINADGHARAANRARGSATLFPSFMPHRVTPVTAGDRYSLTTWIHGPAFR